MKKTIISIMAIVSISSASMCEYYIDKASENLELFSVDLRVHHLEFALEYSIKAKYACPVGVRDVLNDRIEEIKNNIIEAREKGLE